MEGLAGLDVPDTCCLALVGEADTLDVFLLVPLGNECLGALVYTLCAGIDQSLGVMLVPSVKRRASVWEGCMCCWSEDSHPDCG